MFNSLTFGGLKAGCSPLCCSVQGMSVEGSLGPLGHFDVPPGAHSVLFFFFPNLFSALLKQTANIRLIRAFKHGPSHILR